jgi:hypothetical protein
MKVQVWTKLSKKTLWKKVKSPLSMNFGRISTSKCSSSKLASKNGGAVHPFSQKPWPIPQTSKNSFFLNKKFQKNLNCPTGAGVDPRPAGDRWPRVDTCACGAVPIFFEIFFSSCPPLFVQLVNSCWLAPAHARPAQTSP